MVAILTSAKLVTLCFLKIKVFWNKDYDVTISIHDVITKKLPCDSNYIADMVM